MTTIGSVLHNYRNDPRLLPALRAFGEEALAAEIAEREAWREWDGVEFDDVRVRYHAARNLSALREALWQLVAERVATVLAPADRAALEDELVEIEAERSRLARRSTSAASRTARSVLQTEYEALGLRAYEILTILKADCDSSGPR